MKTSDIILLVVFTGALLYFVYALLSAFMSGKKQNKQDKKPEKKEQKQQAEKAPQGEKELNIRIRQEADGVHFIVPPSAATIQENSEDLFPHIINDVPPDDKGLTQDYWLRFVSIINMDDPEERERIVNQMAEAGKIRVSDVRAIAMLDPSAVTGMENQPKDEIPERETPAPEEGTQIEMPIPEEEVPQPEEEIPQPEPEPAPDPHEAPQPEAEEDPDSAEQAFINHEFNY